VAKAREIPGLGPDIPFARAAGMTVRVRAQELVDHSDGVLDTEDIERVHAMRVASRRLRAVLEIHAACFPPDLFKPVLKDVKALADALGARRDPDVQLEALRAFADAVGEEERPGVAVFIAQLEMEQDEGNATLADELERIRETDLAGRLQALADAADPPVKPPEPEPEPDDPDEHGVEPETETDLMEGAGAAVEPVPETTPDADRPADDDDPAPAATTLVPLDTPAGNGTPAGDRGRWPGSWGSRS
jgi:hypothetical protein